MQFWVKSGIAPAPEMPKWTKQKQNTIHKVNGVLLILPFQKIENIIKTQNFIEAGTWNSQCQLLVLRHFNGQMWVECCVKCAESTDLCIYSVPPPIAIYKHVNTATVQPIHTHFLIPAHCAWARLEHKTGASSSFRTVFRGWIIRVGDDGRELFCHSIIIAPVFSCKRIKGIKWFSRLKKIKIHFRHEILLHF